MNVCMFGAYSKAISSILFIPIPHKLLHTHALVSQFFLLLLLFHSPYFIIW